MKPVSLRALAECVDRSSDAFTVFIDPRTGEVYAVDGKYGPESDRELLDEPGMVFVPDIDTSEEVRWMREFAEGQDDPKVRGPLLATFGGPRLFRRFKDMAHGLGVLRAWQDERDRRSVAWLRSWLETEAIAFVDDLPDGAGTWTPAAQSPRAEPTSAAAPADAPPSGSPSGGNAPSPVEVPPGRPRLRVLKGGRYRPSR